MIKYLRFLAFLTSLLLISLVSLWADTEETGGIYPSESQGTDTNTISPKREPLENLPGQPTDIPGGGGGGKDLRIASQSQNEIRPHYYVLEGYVDIQYKGMRLQSDHAEYDADTRNLIATGNVVLDQQDQRITGKRLEINIDTQKGTMYDAFGFIPPQVFFWGSKLDKLGEQKYRLYDGVVTECSQIMPHWQLDTTAATITINDYIKFQKFELKAKSLPIFYSPFMMWPIKRERATGFLMPSFGPNSKKGFWIGGSFFWAMGRSMDTTYWVDHYADRGWGGGVQYEYASNKDSGGSIKYYYADDTQLGQQYTIDGQVTQTLPKDYRVAAVLDKFSSYQYIRDYSNSLARAVSLTQTVQAFLTRNWSYYSLNVLADWSAKQGSNQNIVSTYYHYPEVQFQSRDQQIPHTPIFTNLQTSFDYLGSGITFKDVPFNDYFYRYDVFPEVYWPVTYLPWLTFTPTFGYRYTYYSDTIDPISQELRGIPFGRKINALTLDLRGPNFGKVFDTPQSSYSQKWKHAIEPEITYDFISDIPDKQFIDITDGDVDGIFGSKSVTYSITNYLYSKRPIKPQENYKSDEYEYYIPKTEEDTLTSPWEFISWKLSQSYRFQSDSYHPTLTDQSPFTDVSSVLRINPSENYSNELDLSYNMQHTQLTSIRVTSSLKHEDIWYSNVSYVYSQPVSFNILVPGQPVPRAGNSLQFNAGVGLMNNRFVFSGDSGYNITDKELLTASLGFAFNEDCYSIGIQYKHFSNVIRVNGKENQIVFSISLPNIGNLVSFNNGAPPKRY
jgi:LPS-assembly protein